MIEEDSNDIPNVPVKRVETTKEGYRLVIDCPYCGHEHRHGGGSLSENWRQFGGHRLSHCEPRKSPNDGYVIVTEEY